MVPNGFLDPLVPLLRRQRVAAGSLRACIPIAARGAALCDGARQGQRLRRNQQRLPLPLPLAGLVISCRSPR